MADSEAEFEYRSMEPLAVVAAILGAVSAVAFVAPLLRLVPLVGIAAAGIALLRIHKVPERSGRSVALVGLGLSLFCLSAPIARSFSERILLGRQARAVSDQFLAYLVERKPEKALLLQFAPDARPPADARLWSRYRNDPYAQEQLRKLIAKPEVRMLLALGERAQVRFVQTAGVVTAGPSAAVNEEYAITFTDRDGKKKTLLVGVLVDRKPPKDPSVSPWKISDISAALSQSQAIASPSQ